MPEIRARRKHAHRIAWASVKRFCVKAGDRRVVPQFEISFFIGAALLGSSVTSMVAILAIMMAAPITSAGRFSPLGLLGIRDCPFLRVVLCLIPSLKPLLTFVAVFWIRTRSSFYAATESVHAFVKRVTAGRDRHLFTPILSAKHIRSEAPARAEGGR
jgi:hypothetical protein